MLQRLRRHSFDLAQPPICEAHFLFLDFAGGEIRLKGRNLSENEHVKLGAYHTVELERHRAFTIAKACWDGLDLERLQQACDPQASADLAAVLITV